MEEISLENDCSVDKTTLSSFLMNVPLDSNDRDTSRLESIENGYPESKESIQSSEENVLEEKLYQDASQSSVLSTEPSNETGDNSSIESMEQVITSLSCILNIDSQKIPSIEKLLSRYQQSSENKFAENIHDLVKEKNKLQEKISLLREEASRKESDAKKTNQDEKNDLMQRLEKANKLAEAKKRELEGMVMKYATSESQILSFKKQRDNFEKRMKDALKDKESLLVRIKGLSNEKISLNSQLDQRNSELNSVHKEMEKLRMVLKEKEAKQINSEFKLTQEEEAHCLTKKSLEQAQSEVIKVKEAFENLKESNQVEVATSEAVTQLQNQLKTEQESSSAEIARLQSENDSLLNKIKSLEEQKLTYEKNAEKSIEHIKTLQMKLADLDEIKQKLVSVNQQLHDCRLANDSLQQQLSNIKLENEELQNEMESCKQKEGELLEFTDRLQTKTVNLQSEHNLLEQKYEGAERELNELRLLAKELENKCQELNAQLKSDMCNWQSEKKTLTTELSMSQEKISNLEQIHEELQNELRVLKKRNVNSVKELNRELISLKRRLDLTEANSDAPDAVSSSSRTASSTSLERPNLVEVTQPNESVINVQPMNGKSSEPLADAYPQIDKQMLLNKIGSLQRALAKRREKIEFLEEHNNQLLEDIKKKTKLIQNYIIREEAGALTTNAMDSYKEKLAKKGGGIMSSLYKTNSSDSTMTLEFSLEINRKLQAVLEDTLLKNITLKENINTLGNEIARISNQPSTSI